MNEEGEQLKRCTVCGETFPVTDFHSNGLGGRRADCKHCRAETFRMRKIDPSYKPTYVAAPPRGRQLSEKNKIILDGIRSYIEDVGCATSREICEEILEDTGLRNLYNMRHLYLPWLRNKLKKEGLYFYSVKGKYQILDEETYVPCLIENKRRWEGATRSIREIMKHGVEDCPEIQQDIIQLLGEMNLAMLKGAQTQQLTTPKDESDTK